MSIRPPRTPPTAPSPELRLEYVLRLGLAYLSIGCQGESKRPRRSERGHGPEDSGDAAVPSLGAVASDADDRVVYVDLASTLLDAKALAWFYIFCVLECKKDREP